MNAAKAKPTCTIDDFASDEVFDRPLLIVKVDDSKTKGPSGWLEIIKEGKAAVHPGLVDYFKRIYGEQLDGVTIPTLSEHQVKYFEKLVYNEESSNFKPRIQKRIDELVEPCNFPHTIYVPAGSAY